ncbi:hypothetical protein ACFLYF_01035 [Chloroflexota bacterium]
MSQKSGVRKIFKLVLMAIGFGIIGIAFGVIDALIGSRVLGADTISECDRLELAQESNKAQYLCFRWSST